MTRPLPEHADGLGEARQLRTMVRIEQAAHFLLVDTELSS